MSDAEYPQKQTIKLDKSQELRIKCKTGVTISVLVRQQSKHSQLSKSQHLGFAQLTDGSAEIFGTDLRVGEPVQLNNQAAGIFTWYGATLEVSGQPELMEVVDETQMQVYLNTHYVINKRRQGSKDAGDSSAMGPRVIVVGPTDVGKSTFCKILLNYAVRTGWHPTYVDLDIGQGNIVVPGCLSAVTVDSAISVSGYQAYLPLVLYYGHLTPTVNPLLYKFQVEQLASMLSVRDSKSPTRRHAGIIVNTMGWVEGLGLELLYHAIDSFNIDVILCLGSNELVQQLQAEYLDQKRASRPVNIVNLKLSPGVFTRDTEARRAARDSRIFHYFRGISRQFTPYNGSMDIHQVKVFRVGYRDEQRDLIVDGRNGGGGGLMVYPVQLTQGLVGRLLAVSHARQSAFIATYNVAGFIHIMEVDEVEGRFTYLAPNAGELPSEFLLVGDVAWNPAGGGGGS